MRGIRIFLVLILAALIGWGILRLIKEHGTLDDEVKILQEKRNAAKEENASVSEKIDFFKDPENLIKELKSQTNVVVPGEKLIILVPSHASSSATSSQGIGN